MTYTSAAERLRAIVSRAPRPLSIHELRCASQVRRCLGGPATARGDARDLGFKAKAPQSSSALNSEALDAEDRARWSWSGPSCPFGGLSKCVARVGWVTMARRGAPSPR